MALDRVLSPISSSVFMSWRGRASQAAPVSVIDLMDWRQHAAHAAILIATPSLIFFEDVRSFFMPTLVQTTGSDVRTERARCMLIPVWIIICSSARLNFSVCFI